MGDPAKVMLSELEASLVNNSEWILTKHVIMHKAAELLAAQVPVIDELFAGVWDAELPHWAPAAPRVSRGERYLDLPYVILDHPAHFSKENIAALRTMFWWGNFISVTLHLSGAYKHALADRLAVNLAATPGSFFISAGREEWQHHFEAGNYLPAAAMPAGALYKKIVQPSFVKIALKYPLEQWSNMNDLLREAYSSVASLLKH